MRKLLLTGILLGVTFLSFGQMKFAVGPKLGLGFNTLSEKYNGQSTQEFYNALFSGSEIDASVFNIGFVWGGFVELRFTDWLAIQGEYLMSNEGTGVKFTEDGDPYNDGDFDFTRRFKMTNIPVLLKVGVAEYVDIYGGVQLASLRKITEFTGTRSPDNKPEEIPKDQWENDIKDSWTAIVVGVSVEQQGVVIDLRATIGPEIGKNPDSYSAHPLTGQLTLGYKIFGKRD